MQKPLCKRWVGILVVLLRSLQCRLFSSHLRSGSRKMWNRFGPCVSPWVVPRFIGIRSGMERKWLPWNAVVEFVYMLPTITHLRSSIVASL